MNRITNYEQLCTDIVAWIKDYADSNNIKSLVVGVSGGIDSAVVSTLCAMTGLPVHMCVIDIFSNSEHITTATGHCVWLSSQYSNIGIYNIDMSGVMSNISIPFAGTVPLELPAANTRSRLRMITLYNYATCYNGIVVGTGNKVEDFGIGFFTKYGDGGVDISPIADLYKTEVRELGRYLGIADEIINAAPTDGLWGSQQRTDEEVLGATYEELEWAMEHDAHRGGYIAMTDRQQQVFQIYHELHNKNKHKMLPIPVYKLKL